MSSIRPWHNLACLKANPGSECTCWCGGMAHGLLRMGYSLSEGVKLRAIIEEQFKKKLGKEA